MEPRLYSTALLLVDPYNDFLAEGGKLWPMVREVATSVGLLDNLRAILREVRRAEIPVFVVPHHRAEPDDLAGFAHPTPYQSAAAEAQVFARGSFGGEWHPEFAPMPDDVIVKEHWLSSGFANTDLDYRLRTRRITHLVLVGLLANTCIEATARFGVELGYHVTLVRDATAAESAEAMRAAHDLNGPNFAHAIVTTAELIASFSATADSERSSG